MKVVVACGGFKEGPGAEAVCSLISAGIRRLGNAAISVETVPLADGGTGLAHFLAREQGGSHVPVTVHGPRSKKVQASYTVLLDGTCALEVASAAGLALLRPPERNPMLTTSIGVGEIIKTAAQSGHRKFLVGCGDSASNDCGAGLAAALGVQFTDAFSQPVPPRGQHLRDIAQITVPEPVASLIRECTFEVACNPSSILCGPQGTSRVYGPQKGADSREVEELATGAESFVALLESVSGTQLAYLPGAGGAGGIAGMLYALFGASLTFSFDLVRRVTNLDCRLKDADLLVTAEGCLDARTLAGKLPGALALYAKRFDVPTAAVVGDLADNLDLLYLSGFDAVEIVTKRPCTVPDALDSVQAWLPDAAERLVRKILLGQSLGTSR